MNPYESYSSSVTSLSSNNYYRYYVSDWCKVRDCVAGERRIKERKETYLPRLSTGQKDAAYLAYLGRARFLGATSRTLQGFLGSIFRKDASITLPSSLEKLAKNIDRQGTTAQEFVQEATKEVLTTGRAGVLVDHEKSPQGQAYLVLYKAEEIVDWGTSIQKDERVLSLVDLVYTVDDVVNGQSTCVQERRCLTLMDGVYTQIVYEYYSDEKTKKSEWREKQIVIPTIKGKSLDYIPFVFLGPESTKPEVQKSPLLDIAEINIHHYKGSADWKHSLFLVACPSPYSINMKREKNAPEIELGPGKFNEFQGDDGCTVSFLEITGQGLELIRTDLQDMKDEMAAMGAAYLTPPKREAETAEALQLKTSAANSPLAKICSAIERGITQALKWWATWNGAPDSEVECRINKDFDKTRLSPDDLLKLSQALQSGAITAETYANLLHEAEMLPPEIDAKTFAAQLEAEKEAKKAIAVQISQGQQPNNAQTTAPNNGQPVQNGNMS